MMMNRQTTVQKRLMRSLAALKRASMPELYDLSHRDVSLWLLCSCACLCSAPWGFFPFSIAPLLRAGHSVWDVGMILPSMSLSCLSVTALLIRYGERLRSRRVVLSACASQVMGCFVVIVAGERNYAGILVGHIIYGLGHGMWNYVPYSQLAARSSYKTYAVWYHRFERARLVVGGIGSRLLMMIATTSRPDPGTTWSWRTPWLILLIGLAIHVAVFARMLWISTPSVERARGARARGGRSGRSRLHGGAGAEGEGGGQEDNDQEPPIPKPIDAMMIARNPVAAVGLLAWLVCAFSQAGLSTWAPSLADRAFAVHSGGIEAACVWVGGLTCMVSYCLGAALCVVLVVDESKGKLDALMNHLMPLLATAVVFAAVVVPLSAAVDPYIFGVALVPAIVMLFVVTTAFISMPELLHIEADRAVELLSRGALVTTLVGEVVANVAVAGTLDSGGHGSAVALLGASSAIGLLLAGLFFASVCLHPMLKPLGRKLAPFAWWHRHVVGLMTFVANWRARNSTASESLERPYGGSRDHTKALGEDKKYKNGQQDEKSWTLLRRQNHVAIRGVALPRLTGDDDPENNGDDFQGALDEDYESNEEDFELDNNDENAAERARWKRRRACLGAIIVARGLSFGVPLGVPGEHGKSNVPLSPSEMRVEKEVVTEALKAAVNEGVLSNSDLYLLEPDEIKERLIEALSAPVPGGGSRLHFLKERFKGLHVERM